MINTLRVKRFTDSAILPTKGTDGSAGLDLYANEIIRLDDYHAWYKLGIGIELPHGYYAEVFPRSSVSKRNMILLNSVGVIDNDFRGNIQARFYRLPNSKPYKVGDRVAQLVIKRDYNRYFRMAEVDDISDTSRGEGGFGSTGA
jgi:dUTP pyrophosphatase